MTLQNIWLVSFNDAPGPTLMMILQVQHQQGHIRSSHCQNTWFPTGFPPGLAEIINLCRCKLSKFSEQWPFFFSSINSPTERNTLWKIKTENTKKQAWRTLPLRHVGNDTTLFSPITGKAFLLHSTITLSTYAYSTVQTQKWVWQGPTRSLEVDESHSGNCGRFPAEQKLMRQVEGTTKKYIYRSSSQLK